MLTEKKKKSHKEWMIFFFPILKPVLKFLYQNGNHGCTFFCCSQDCVVSVSNAYNYLP